jgi:hypothetical protein
MGTIQIKKVEKTVTTGKQGEERQKVKKTYGKIIYRGTLSLYDMAEHIMKQGTQLSTQLWSEMTEDLTPSPSPTGEGSGNTGGGSLTPNPSPTGEGNGNTGGGGDNGGDDDAPNEN